MHRVADRLEPPTATATRNKHSLSMELWNLCLPFPWLCYSHVISFYEPSSTSFPIPSNLNLPPPNYFREILFSSSRISHSSRSRKCGVAFSRLRNFTDEARHSIEVWHSIHHDGDQKSHFQVPLHLINGLMRMFAGKRRSLGEPMIH